MWKTAQNVVSHTAHSPVLFLAEEEEQIKDKNVLTSTVQIYAIPSCGDRRIRFRRLNRGPTHFAAALMPTASAMSRSFSAAARSTCSSPRSATRPSGS